EERFSRVKHDPGFPQQAIEYCLSEAGIAAGDLDQVGFYDKPFLKFERLLETYVATAPLGIRSFFKSVPVWLQQKLHLPREMRRALGGDFKKRFVFTEHHESHAASAFFPSPFESAAILTLDGVGEWATASFGSGCGNRIELTHELHFPHSLGLLYSAFTHYCGFRVNSGEYKLMGLAPFGEPRFVDLITRHLLDLKADGSFRMDMSYFNYCAGLTMTSSKFDALFGQPRREPESEIGEFYMDVAASIQAVTEEIVLRIARHVREVTGEKNLCLAGGVALNCVGNGKVLREGVFDNLWVQPAANDAGGALGVAQFIWHQLLEQPRVAAPGDRQAGSLLGPGFDHVACAEVLGNAGATFRHIAAAGERCRWIAERIAEGKVVGLMQGRMEFGPRALGCRSILGDPRSPKMQRLINQKIKYRESFRPFAPSVLHDRVTDWFELGPGQESPYMLMVASVRESKRLPAAASGGAQGLARLQIPRSEIPAVTHVDDSARVQTVDPLRHPFYHQMIGEFEALTGCPLVINTSFNVRGEPIVCTPDDAYRCFMATEMDVLVLDDLVLLKEEQEAAP
ncbi:MAG: carbamoyltransferase family protein, partial [Verrucomicrobiales bacterium]